MLVRGYPVRVTGKESARCELRRSRPRTARIRPHARGFGGPRKIVRAPPPGSPQPTSGYRNQGLGRGCGSGACVWSGARVWSGAPFGGLRFVVGLRPCCSLGCSLRYAPLGVVGDSLALVVAFRGAIPHRFAPRAAHPLALRAASASLARTSLAAPTAVRRLRSPGQRRRSRCASGGAAHAWGPRRLTSARRSAAHGGQGEIPQSARCEISPRLASRQPRASGTFVGARSAMLISAASTPALAPCVRREDQLQPVLGEVQHSPRREHTRRRGGFSHRTYPQPAADRLPGAGSIIKSTICQEK